MTTPAVLIGLLLLAGLLIWRRWHRATREQRVDLSTLGGGFAGAVGSLAMIVLARAGAPSSTQSLVVGAAAAVAGGAALAVFSARHTTLRSAPDGARYRPDSRIGIAVFVVLVVAVALKAAQVLTAIDVARGSGQSPFDAAVGTVDPLTTIIIAFSAAYLGWYQLFVFRRVWRAGVRQRLVWPDSGDAERRRRTRDTVKANLKGLRDQAKGR